MPVPFRGRRIIALADVGAALSDLSDALSQPIVHDWGTVSGNATLDVQIADVNTVTLGASITNLTFAKTAVPERTRVRLVITQDGTGGRTITNYVNATQAAGRNTPLEPSASAFDDFWLEWTGTTWLMWPTGPKTGSFTPTITFGGGSTGITYTSHLGRYVKHGPLIESFEIYILLSSKGSSTGVLAINGFPFTINNVTGSVAVIAGNNMTGLSGAVLAILIGASTHANIAYLGTGSKTNIDDTNCTNTTELQVAGSYST